MPAIQSFLSDQLNKLNISSPHRPIPQPSKSSKRYYLSHPPSILSPTNALSPIPYPSSPRQLPSTSLLFSLEHPDPSTSPSISFFLSAIPDPIGFLYHSSILIRLHFTAEEVESGESGWRHQLMELELKDGPGLAETSGGKITVSLKWIGDIMREVERGQRDMPAAVKEFKGVLLHEAVHTIQHDGQSTCPGWLVESIADYIRLRAHLDPPHWKKAGQGKKEKGWEEGYDSGARFLDWAVGNRDGDGDGAGSEDGGDGTAETEGTDMGSEQPTRTFGPTPAVPTSTKYPEYYPDAPPPPPRLPAKGGKGKGKGKKRNGPWPNLVCELDARLKDAKWDDGWWVEITGFGLGDLWEEYLGYYS